MKNILDDAQVIIPDLFATHARHYPMKTAIICGDQQRNWGDFVGNINRVANYLIANGIKRGEHVAVMMGNSPEMLECLFGVIRAGACVVPLSGLLTSDQIKGLLQDSHAIAAFISPEFEDRIMPVQELLTDIITWVGQDTGLKDAVDLTIVYEGSPDTIPNVQHDLNDAFNIIYSSGTTGVPKGIVQTHRARLHWAFSNAIEMGFRSSSIALTTTPLYSNGTWLMMLPILFVGGTLHIMQSFDAAKFLKIVEQEKITHTFMVPAQFLMVLEQPALAQSNLTSLVTVLSAGSPLRRDIKREIIEKISSGLFELYGFSEGFATMLKPDQHATKFDTVGTPVLGFEVRILDDEGNEVPTGDPGEIAGYGAGIMQKYNNQEDLTKKLIWYDERGRSFIRSGDIGALDEDGFLKILDRKKDMIISGGFNIFPTDVEAIVGQHTDVLDVTVIGVPHSKWGETCLALIIPTKGSSPDPEQVKNWANERLSRIQRLEKVEIRDEFPRNALGKVIKKELRAPYWENYTA